MINVEGRIREDRRAKGGVSNSRATRNHLGFSDFGVVGKDDPEFASLNLGKKKLEPKEAREIELRGKKVLSEDEIREKFGKVRKFGKLHLKPYKSEHDGEEKPRGPPPGANLTARERAEKIVQTAIHQDPALSTAVENAKQHFGADNGLFEAVKVVQRAEAARHVEKRDTKAAHLRSDKEPSKLVAPFFQATTQEVKPDSLRYSKRMINDPALTTEDRSPARPEGKGRGAPPASEHHTPFDTSGTAHYPDPPQVGKGREIQEPSGKKRVDVKVCEFDLDQIAQRKATARCGAHSDKGMPEFVLGNPGPGRKIGKNASPEKNRSGFSLGRENYVSESRPSTAQNSVSSYSSATPAQMNRRNAFAHMKNSSTALW